MINTREQPQWSTFKPQVIRDFSYRSPHALHPLPSPSNPPQWGWIKLLQSGVGPRTSSQPWLHCSDTHSLHSFSPGASHYTVWTFGQGLHHKLIIWRQSGSPQTGWLNLLYEHNQLFKPLLFTDNLFSIQLFILVLSRLRQSPSHKQMKSNKALLTNYTEDTGTHSHRGWMYLLVNWLN